MPRGRLELVWSNPNQEGHLVLADPGSGRLGKPQRNCFDVSPLKNAYSRINSVTIRLTQGSTSWSQSFMRYGGTIEVYRLKAENAAWNNNATFRCWRIRTVDVTWVGGIQGDGFRAWTMTEFCWPQQLCQQRSRSAGGGIIYDLVIPGHLAVAFMDQWSAGGVNEGFVVYAPSDEGDNRLFLVPEGENGPKLIVDYEPVTGLAVITTPPANVSVGEGGSATFSVTATGAPPLRYQWLRNGQTITGATSTQFSIDPVQIQDDQARFSVRVTDAAESSVTSQEAVLTVLADTTAATVVSATGDERHHGQRGVLRTCDGRDRRAKDNYRISGNITVESAKLVGDSTVVLTTIPQTIKASYTLTINGIRDRSAAGNQIATDTQATFRTPTPTVAIPLQHRASGVSWNLVFSNPNNEGHLPLAMQGDLAHLQPVTLRRAVFERCVQ